MSNSPSSKQRYIYMDALNVLAILGVVFLHLRVAYWSFNTKNPMWWFENLLSGLGVAAVPVFFMLTGAKLMDFIEREAIGTFYKKRLLKVLIPFLVWGQVYLWIFTWHDTGKAPSAHQMLTFLLNPARLDQPLWYIEVLLGIYLVLPFFSIMMSGARKLGLNQSNFLWLLILVGSIAPILMRSIHLIPGITVYPLLSPPFADYLCFIFLGYALFKLELSKSLRILIYFLGFLGYIAFVWGTPQLIPLGNKVAAITDDYLSLPALAISSAFFLAFKNCKFFTTISGALSRPLSFASSLTFGIFLVHQLIIDFIFPPDKVTSPLSSLITTALVVIVSALIVWLLRLIPFIRKWIVP